MGTFEGVLVMGYSSNGTLSGDGNHFGDSRHPKDVPFVGHLSFGGDVHFGGYKPTKNLNFGDRCCRHRLRLYKLCYSTSLARGQHAVFDPIYCSESQIHCNPSSCNFSYSGAWQNLSILVY